MKYCKRFKDNIKYFSPEGQKWVRDTGVCLKKSLVPVINGDGPKDCQGIAKLAFDHHVPCYVDNGFCRLAFHWNSSSEQFHFLRALMKVYDA